jgi:hypothetical protein
LRCIAFAVIVGSSAWHVLIIKLPANLLLATTGNCWQLAAALEGAIGWMTG